MRLFNIYMLLFHTMISMRVAAVYFDSMYMLVIVLYSLVIFWYWNENQMVFGMMTERTIWSSFSFGR